MKPHNKKYYGGLTVIVFLIVATAFLLQMYGSEDIVGLAATDTDIDTLEEGSKFDFEFTTSSGTEIDYRLTYDSSTQKYIIQEKGKAGESLGFDTYEDAITNIEAKYNVYDVAKLVVINSYSTGYIQAEMTFSGNEPPHLVSNFDEFSVPASTTAQETTTSGITQQQWEEGMQILGEQLEEEEQAGTVETEEGIEITEVLGGSEQVQDIIVEPAVEEEIAVSYTDDSGIKYSWDGQVIYDSTTNTFTIDFATDPDLVGYKDKGELLEDLKTFLPSDTASIKLEGKEVTETAPVDKLESLKKVLESTETTAVKTAGEKKAAPTKATGAGTATPTVAKGEYSEEDNTFTITPTAGNKIELKMVKVNGKPYGKYIGEKVTYYYDEGGKVYTMSDEGKLVPHSDTSTLVKDQVLRDLAAVLSDEAKTKDFLEDEKSKANREAKVTAEKHQEIAKHAQEYGVDPADLESEEKAIDNYLTKNYAKERWDYDAASEHYTGGTYNIQYDGDNMGITVKETKDGKETTQTIYKSREKGKTTYYTLDDDGNEEKVKETSALKKQFRDAEKEQDRLVSDVRNKLKNGDIPSTYKMSIAEAHYLQEQYEQQRMQVKGLLTGYLNKWLDKQLGGWSRGVPAGICAQVFGLEYYKENGWNRVPMNASSYELQSYLLANSKTAIIEGEKEEITDSLFRYAYSLRLLANQSLEWQTYLYNSCSQETSEEVFYDYGALGAGEYYSFHYAGTAEQDMIFDCEQEDCLFDQACVEFTDGSETVCVSLVHGAGFETPNTGSDYDCI